MIFYCTKETMERFHLKTPSEMREPMRSACQAVVALECEKNIYQWGAKLFYFDGRKCMQVMHILSGLTVFVIDIKKDDLPLIGNHVAEYVFDIYKGDRKMTRALEKYYRSSPMVVMDRLQDRSAMASLNSTLRFWAEDGDRFYEYIRDGILHTLEINRDVNDLPRKAIGFRTPKEVFRKIICEFINE